MTILMMNPTGAFEVSLSSSSLSSYRRQIVRYHHGPFASTIRFKDYNDVTSSSSSSSSSSSQSSLLLWARRTSSYNDQDDDETSEYDDNDNDNQDYEEMELESENPWGSLDPTSDLAQQIVLNDLECTTEQYDKLVALSYLITDWNERINLVSRKDCTPATVFGRHILPCIAIKAISFEQGNPLDTTSSSSTKSLRIVDVGTGGGFPGLPLAICYPQHSFTLMDSVGKKLTAVADMAAQLELDTHTNDNPVRTVRTHHGRAEDFAHGQFDVATGRSVSDLSQFCAWMHHLLRPQKEQQEPAAAQLLYWTGGELPSRVLEKASHQWPLSETVPALASLQTPDDPVGKRILGLSQRAVQTLAKESGITVLRRPAASSSSKKQPPQGKNKNHTSKPSASPRRKTARGAWQKRGNNNNDDDDSYTAPKQRGYENFQRYSSMDQWKGKNQND